MFVLVRRMAVSFVLVRSWIKSLQVRKISLRSMPFYLSFVPHNLWVQVVVS